MTQGLDHFEDLKPNPVLKNVKYQGYDHVTFYVSNSKLAAAYFISSLGFSPLSYKGLETGSRAVCSHVVKNGNAVFQFISPLKNGFKHNKANDIAVKEILKFVVKHGDAVKDVAFTVDRVDEIYSTAVTNGAKCVLAPHTVSDKFGTVRLARVGVFGDTTHTLINRTNYEGSFLPGYESVENKNYFSSFNTDLIRSFPPVKLQDIDHCVQNQGWNQMNESCKLYAQAFGFHRFWSVDEDDVSTEYSALKSMVMTGNKDIVKMPINEPAVGRCKSQIEEFLDYNDGPGIQHIAISTSDIITCITSLKARGCEFITVPEKYYQDLKERLKYSTVQISESLEEIQKLGILVDFDDNGYLLQLFTKPLLDRPTIFLEIIQRHNHNGFGKGNFKALFETIETEQRARGNLTGEYDSE